MDGKMEDGLAAFLESKRNSFEAAPGFEDRVMAAVRKSDAPARRAIRGSALGKGRTGWIAWLDWRGALRRIFATPSARALWAPAGLAMALGLFLCLRPLHDPAGRGLEGAPGGTRIKGEAFSFAVVVQEGDTGYRKVEGEARLRAGDRIQAMYWLADTAHVELLSLDASGKAECYSCGRQADPYGPAAGRLLPFGLELDATPGPELFILAASPERRGADQLKAALQRAWRDAGTDLGKTAGRLRRDEGKTMYRTLMVRKGEGL